MRFLDEHRRRPAALADHLPWAALVAPGVVLNKDGAFTTGFRFRGPDLESASETELMAVRARLNNALRRLGDGWCLHVEASRRSAAAYPESAFSIDVAWLADAERREGFESADPAFETDFRLALTWLPPGDETRRLERWLFDGLSRTGADWRQTLALFEREVEATFDLLAGALPEIERLDDQGLLTWLHACVSPMAMTVRPPDTPMFLDVLLADAALTGGTEPRLGSRWLKVVSVRGLPATTRPGLLDSLGALPFPYRWTARWIALDKTGAELEIVRMRKRWFAKRKGLGVLLREAITKEETPLLDTDSIGKTGECDAALAALGADACAYGYLSLTVSVLGETADRAEARARAVEAALNAQGLVARVEDLNAVEAWLGSIPGEPYADVRRPMISSLNLADLLPVSAVWAGPEGDAALEGPPLAVARTLGSTPFRLVLHVGDVGHAMVVGPTGAGKSVLLAFLALQWFRYPGARVVFFDKGRSARAATLAAGGRWRSLGPGGDVRLQPLARIDEAGERAWAAEWLADCARHAGLEAVPEVRDAIWSALGAMAAAPVDQRTLTVFHALVQHPALAAALEPLTLRGPHGDLLDGVETGQGDSPFDTFELETLMAVANLALAAFLGAGWWVQADRAVVRPFVVEVSEWGETQKITALDGRYEPTDAQIGHALAGWVRDVRSKSMDPIVIRQNWLRAYDLLSPRAAAFLNAWAQAHDPFAEAGREAVTVEVLNVVRRTGRTYDLQWRETRYLNGQNAGAERWRALITTGRQAPRTEAELMKNPLGLKIEDVSWTPDAS